MKTIQISALFFAVIMPALSLSNEPVLGTKEAVSLNGNNNKITSSFVSERVLRTPSEAWRNVKIMTPINYRVRRGDSLHRLARRYQVSLDTLRSREFNPKLADRKNRNLLLRGEVIVIPLYRSVPLQSKNDLVYTFSVKKNEFVAMSLKDANVIQNESSMIIEKKNLELERTHGALDRIGLFLSIAVAGLIGLVSLIFYKFWDNKEITPEQVIKSLQRARGSVLSSVVDLPITSDEVGNPVNIKNIKNYMDKRPYLAELPVGSWSSAQAELNK